MTLGHTDDSGCPKCGGIHDPAFTPCVRRSDVESEPTNLDDKLLAGVRDTPADTGRKRTETGDYPTSIVGERTSPVAVGALGPSGLHPGAMVGEFVVEGQIGAGGMGVVYRATHPLIGKKAVIKVIKADLGNDVEHVQRFIREARAVNQIGHPNIVDVFSFGTLPDRRPYLIMEWLQGQSLGARLDHGPLPIREGLEILLQICSALDAAHTYGVIHRDLKPDNVYLVALPNDERPLVKLLDFGLAKITEAKKDLFLGGSNAGVILGTPTYLSPEQARGQTSDHRSDIYALGIMAFEMMTGRRPFVGSSPIDTIFLHVSAARPHARQLAPQVPEEIDTLLIQMMAKDPADRPSLSRIRALLAAVAGRTAPAVDEPHEAGGAEEETTGARTSDFSSAIRRISPTRDPSWTGEVGREAMSDLEERAAEPAHEEATRTDTDAVGKNGAALRSDSGPLAHSWPSLPGVRKPDKLMDSSSELRISGVGIVVPKEMLSRGQPTFTPEHPEENEATRLQTPSGMDSIARLSSGLDLVSMPALELDEELPPPPSPPRRESQIDQEAALRARELPLPPPVQHLRTEQLRAITGWMDTLRSRVQGVLRGRSAIAGAIVALTLLLLVTAAISRWSANPHGVGDQVSVSVHGLPASSSLSWGGRVLDANPAWVPRSNDPSTLSISSPGYETVKVELVPNKNLEFTVELGAPRR